jgi:hypothetical protein
MSEYTGADAPMPTVDTVGEQAEVTPGLNTADAGSSSVEREEFQRVVDQRQHIKKELRDAKAQLEKIANEKAAEQGQWQEMFQKRDSQYKDLHQSWLKDKVQLGVSTALNGAGCIDGELALAAGRGDLLEFDETTGQVGGVDMWLQDVKERKPHLFQPVRTPTINPSVPGGGARATSTVQTRAYDQMSSEELMQQLAAVSKQLKGN